MDGIELGARFSLATSRLQYCGPDGADRTLYRAITDPTARPAARAALQRFEALTPYLETIAGAHGLDPFDERVTEAYWIGNELLDPLGRPEFRALLERLRRRGLPRSLAESLEKRLPAAPLLHHLFHVAYVGVGNVTGHVATTLANMEACRPSWGRVTAVGTDTLDVLVRPLARNGTTLALGAEERLRLPWDALVLPDVRPGATVGFHWGTPALVLDDRRRRHLEVYTARGLVAANEALSGLDAFEGVAPGRAASEGAAAGR